MSRKAPLTAPEYLGLRLATWASFAGFVVSGVLVLNHFNKADVGFCTIGDLFSCNLVNTSPYSEILGVPVALTGMLGFLAVATLSTARLAQPRRGLGRMAPPLLTGAVAAGLGLGGYLLLIEVFVLGVVCLLCAASLILFILAAFALRHTLVLPEALRLARRRRDVPAEGD